MKEKEKEEKTIILSYKLNAKTKLQNVSWAIKIETDSEDIVRHVSKENKMVWPRKEERRAVSAETIYGMETTRLETENVTGGRADKVGEGDDG